MTDAQLGTIGILGGTGDQGRGLAYRWAASGLDVIVGSRDAQRAQAAADEIGFGVRGDANPNVAVAADIVVVAVPWDGHAELLKSIAALVAGKIVVDCVNPIGFDDKGAYPLEVAEGSAAQQTAAILADSRVVAAFHHVSAVLLNDRAVDAIDCDIMGLGDDRAATDIVTPLAARIPGARGVYAGRLRNAHQIEALTANLISVNRRYRVHAGVRLTDV
ncbi:MAG TPA: NADPH-dependent F420 reductase [Acidothermaceae bacterium]|nr:NADPH-dependent F420 reductase [Acidothermaceae bacterium]